MKKHLIRLKKVISIIRKRIYLFPQEKVFLSWFKENGDKTLRQSYDLNEDSVVIDLGGYEGQWTSDIFSRYCCKIHVFEPVHVYAQDIMKRFERNSKINIYDFGLANCNINSSIHLSADGSSMHNIGENDSEQIRLVEAKSFFEENNIKKIDLLKINIEGAEYDLLDHLIETNVISIIDNIQVQFHEFIPDAKQRMNAIQKKLSKTHLLTFQYSFVWENWVKK
jgi:FkbM family methyltransferase